MHFATILRRVENQKLVSGGVSTALRHRLGRIRQPTLRETDDVRIDRGALLTSVVTTSNNKECHSDCKQVETHTL
jgi:hypothetical protein